MDTLRLVVGRGIHSTGGEAILPRAVEGHLVRCRRRFTVQGGSIEVHLRRPSARRRPRAWQTH